MTTKSRTFLFSFLILIPLLAVSAWAFWSDMINFMLPADSRPGQITYDVESVSAAEFDAIAGQLAEEFDMDFPHVEIFREAGITAYEGPKTCLTCHEDITVEDASSGDEKTVSLMHNLLTSTHYRFFTERHTNVWGSTVNSRTISPWARSTVPVPSPAALP